MDLSGSVQRADTKMFSCMVDMRRLRPYFAASESATNMMHKLESCQNSHYKGPCIENRTNILDTHRVSVSPRSLESGFYKYKTRMPHHCTHVPNATRRLRANSLLKQSNNAHAPSMNHCFSEVPTSTHTDLIFVSFSFRTPNSNNRSQITSLLSIMPLSTESPSSSFSELQPPRINIS